VCWLGTVHHQRSLGAHVLVQGTRRLAEEVYLSLEIRANGLVVLLVKVQLQQGLGLADWVFW